MADVSTATAAGVYGISLIGAAAAGVALWAFRKKALLSRGRVMQQVAAKAHPWLLFVFTAGLTVPGVDWVLSWFGGSIHALWGAFIAFLGGLGAHSIAGVSVSTLSRVVLGVIAACALINLIHDSLPKQTVDKGTALGAVYLAVLPSIYVSHGLVTSVMRSFGGGLGHGLASIGASFGIGS